MTTRRITAACLTLTAHLAVPSSALADSSDFTVSTGIKATRASWETATYSSSGVLGPAEKSDSSALAYTPFVSLRNGNWVANLAMMPAANYRFGTQPVKKSETDISAGYAFDGNYVLLGYKSVHQDWSGFKQDNAGPYIGLQATQRFVGSLGGYVQLAYSPSFRAKYSNGRQSDGTYYVVDFGLLYSFGPVIPATKNLAVSLGYRMQVIDTKEFNDTFAGPGVGVVVGF